MGTTGSSDKVAMNSALPDLISRVREYAQVPIAVGFGVSNRGHFDTVADAGADGVVIGSRLVSVIKQAPKGKVAQEVEAYCRQISLKGQPPRPKRTISSASTPRTNINATGPPPYNTESEPTVLPHRFGQFGGQYVPEALFDCLVELEAAHKAAMDDPEFWKEFEGLFGYMNRPSNLYLAERLTEHAGGAKIWMKREDLYAIPFLFVLCFILLISSVGTILAHTKSTTQLGRFVPPSCPIVFATYVVLRFCSQDV